MDEVHEPVYRRLLATLTAQPSQTRYITRLAPLLTLLYWLIYLFFWWRFSEMKISGEWKVFVMGLYCLRVLYWHSPDTNGIAFYLELTYPESLYRLRALRQLRQRKLLNPLTWEMSLSIYALFFYAFIVILSLFRRAH